MRIFPPDGEIWMIEKIDGYIHITSDEGTKIYLKDEDIIHTDAKFKVEENGTELDFFELGTDDLIYVDPFDEDNTQHEVFHDINGQFYYWKKDK